MNRDGFLMSVQLAAQTAFTFSAPQKVLAKRFAFRGGGLSYDVSSDGRRFLVLRDQDNSERRAESGHIVVVLNWREELRVKAPPSGVANAR